MEAYMDIKRAALIWNVTERRVNELCKTGRIEGAFKEEGRWRIPSDAVKPTDKRYKMLIPPSKGPATLLPPPIGVTDYKKACTEYLYMDKTLLIRDLLDEKNQVSVFVRPKRFGKSLNLDMIRTYFEKTDEDTSVYFRDKQIWTSGEIYRSHQGRFPVIYMTFKDMVCDNWKDNLSILKQLIKEECDRHRLDMPANIQNALPVLIKKLHEIYKIEPILIIDEYDTPLLTAKTHGFYEEAAAFINAFYEAGLRENRDLKFGILAGVLCLNKSVRNFTSLDRKFSRHFGFTPDETRRVCDYYNHLEDYEKLSAWYDGYKMGDITILNPWSVLNCVDEEFVPRVHWADNENIISRVLIEGGGETIRGLEILMQGRSFITHIDTSVLYPDISKETSAVYSYLLMNGYLKPVSFERQFDGDYMCEVRIPNKELQSTYGKNILEALEYIVPKAMVIQLRESLFSRDSGILERLLAEFLERAVRYSGSSDGAYHVMILGLCSLMLNDYYFSTSARGMAGNFGIQLTPLTDRLPAIMIELKSLTGNVSEQNLEDTAYNCISQILRMQYDPETKMRYTRQVLKYGVACSGDRVKVVHE